MRGEVWNQSYDVAVVSNQNKLEGTVTDGYFSQVGFARATQSVDWNPWWCCRVRVNRRLCVRLGRLPNRRRSKGRRGRQSRFASSATYNEGAILIRLLTRR